VGKYAKPSPKQPILSKVLGFENFWILDIHLKPQNSPSVLKLESSNIKYRQPQPLQKRYTFLVWGLRNEGLTKLKK